MKTIERTEAQTQARIAFQPKDVLSQVIIAALAVAPDASSIVYVRRTVEDGKYARRLWRTTFGGAKPEQLTSAKASDNRPRFSPDGRSLVFISDRAGKPQAWVISLSGGEPRQVTDIPGGVTAAEWSPDGKKLLLLAASGEKRFIVGNPDDPTARQIRDYTWRFDGLGVRDEFTSVWITDLDEPNPTCITAPSYNVDGAAWSPDGKHIAFLADRSENAGLEEIDAVWTMPAAGGEPTQVARLESGELSLAWTPGDQIAFVGVDRPGFPGWADMELHVSDGRAPRGSLRTSTSTSSPRATATTRTASNSARLRCSGRTNRTWSRWSHTAATAIRTGSGSTAASRRLPSPRPHAAPSPPEAAASRSSPRPPTNPTTSSPSRMASCAGSRPTAPAGTAHSSAASSTSRSRIRKATPSTPGCWPRTANARWRRSSSTYTVAPTPRSARRHGWR